MPDRIMNDRMREIRYDHDLWKIKIELLVEGIKRVEERIQLAGDLRDFLFAKRVERFKGGLVKKLEEYEGELAGLKEAYCKEEAAEFTKVKRKLSFKSWRLQEMKDDIDRGHNSYNEAMDEMDQLKAAGYLAMIETLEGKSLKAEKEVERLTEVIEFHEKRLSEREEVSSDE